MSYTAVKVTPKHIKFVKDNLRKEDFEKLGLTEKEYRKAIKLSVEQSDEVFAWIMDGKAHALGGFTYSPETMNTTIWCTTTPLTDNHPKEVIEAGKKFVESFKGHNLYCCINSTDKRVVKLVEYIGFKPYVKLHEMRHFFVKE